MSETVATLAVLSQRLALAADLESLLDTALACLDDLLGFEHSMLFVPCEEGSGYLALGSRGYAPSGVGAEVEAGEGIVGVAAERRAPVRISNVGYAMRYARATARARGNRETSRVIPLPGLAGVQSQLAVPLVALGQLVGVLLVESAVAGAFDSIAEQIVTIAAGQVAAAIALASGSGETLGDRGTPPPSAGAPDETIAVRYYEEDSSVFLDGEYLIKSLPGRILWRLLVQWRDEQRSEFTNKELRLDAALKLPPVKDNLETRLILLRRRLDERCQHIRIVKAGRGRFRLEITRPLAFEQIGGD